jgi:collagenase-like PrtC family protease
MTIASKRIFPDSHNAPACSALELICCAENLVELRAAVDNGADWVKLDIQADRFGGFGFENAGILKGIRYAHDRRCKVMVSVGGDPLEADWQARRKLVDSAAQFRVDGFVFSDPALMLYASAHYPELQLHYAVAEAASSRAAVDFYRRQFGASRLLLPRATSLSALEGLHDNCAEGFLVFGFGRLATASPHKKTRAALRHQPTASLAASPVLGVAMDANPVSGALERCATEASSANDQCYCNDGMSGLNTLRLLPRLSTAGVRAIVVDAPRHAPWYLAQITRVWREAIDDCLEDIEHYYARPSWIAKLGEQARSASHAVKLHGAA